MGFSAVGDPTICVMPLSKSAIFFSSSCRLPSWFLLLLFSIILWMWSWLAGLPSAFSSKSSKSTYSCWQCSSTTSAMACSSFFFWKCGAIILLYCSTCLLTSPTAFCRRLFHCGNVQCRRTSAGALCELSVNTTCAPDGVVMVISSDSGLLINSPPSAGYSIKAKLSALLDLAENPFLVYLSVVSSNGV